MELNSFHYDPRITQKTHQCEFYYLYFSVTSEYSHRQLISDSSIFSAESNAILLALKFVASSEECKFMICSDSLSCLLAIESCKTQTLSF